MGTLEHTPGPWTPDGWLVLAPDGRKGRSIIGTFGATGIGGVMEEQRKVDARLAAAAPDLLEACERAEATLEALPENAYSLDVQEALGALRAALGKANGVA